MINVKLSEGEYERLLSLIDLGIRYAKNQKSAMDCIELKNVMLNAKHKSEIKANESKS